jgi:hypothetical protein
MDENGKISLKRPNGQFVGYNPTLSGSGVGHYPIGRHARSRALFPIEPRFRFCRNQKRAQFHAHLNKN